MGTSLPEGHQRSCTLATLAHYGQNRLSYRIVSFPTNAMTYRIGPTAPSPFRLVFRVKNISALAGQSESSDRRYQFWNTKPVSFHHFFLWEAAVIKENDALYVVLFCKAPSKKSKRWSCTVDAKITVHKGAEEDDDNPGKHCRVVTDAVFSYDNYTVHKGIILFSDLLNQDYEFVREDAVLLTIDVIPKTTVGIHCMEKLQLVAERNEKKKEIRLFKNEGGSDFRFKTTDGGVFKVSKYILMKGSRVFKAMFRQGAWSEGQRDEHETLLPDIDGRTFKHFRKLLYTQDPTRIDCMSRSRLIKLLYVAEKYQVKWIKSYVAFVLSEGCDVKRAPLLQKLAKRFNLTKMGAEVAAFAHANFHKVWNYVTDRWEE